MTSKKIILSLLCTLCAIITFAVCAAENQETLKILDFEGITSISECPEISGASNSQKGVSCSVKDGVFTVGKHTPSGAAAAAHTVYVNLSEAVKDLDTYSVKLDIMPNFSAGKNFVVRCGANVQLLSRGDGKYVVQRLVDGAFKTENTTEFSFSSLDSGLAFAVKNKEFTDVYYVNGGKLTLIYGDMEYIENSSTKAGFLGFTFNKSSDGDISMDNITVLNYAVKEDEPDPGEIENDITKLEFENISGSIFASLGETVNIPVAAEADSGIERVEVYTDGELYQTLTEAPYAVCLQNIEKESITLSAKAVSGNKSEKEISIIVNFESANNAYTVFEDFDFDEGDSNILDSGISVYQRRGFVKTEQIDEEHGASLLVGTDVPNGAYQAADIPYIDIPLRSSAGRVNIDFDLYVDTPDLSGKKTMVLRFSNDKETNIVRFTGTEMKLLNRLTSSYTEQKWHRFSVRADTVKNTVSIFVDSVPLLCRETLHSTNSDGNLSLKLLRLYGPGEENSGYTAIDNIKVTGFYDLPEITDFKISDKKICAVLSSKVESGSINKETVCLKNESGKNVVLNDVYYDSLTSSVVMITEKNLVPSNEYTVEISESAMLAESVYFGEKVTKSFETAAEIVSFKDAKISVSGKTLTAQISVKNALNSENTVYVVMTLFNKDKGEKMKIVPLTLSGGETKTAVLKEEAGSADSAQVYIYSDVFASRLLGGRIIKKNF